MSKIKKEHHYLNPQELVRSDEHQEAFLSPESGKYEGIDESYKKYGRIKPVYYVVKVKGRRKINEVVDGWKYVEYAKQNGLKEIWVCKLTFEDKNDLVNIMMQLQVSGHGTYEALYKMIQVKWKIHHKGAGYRSDLKGKEAEKLAAVNAKGKPLNIYQRIGRELNLTGTFVKHLRTVGMVNPLYFERLEENRKSLYAAYCECKDEKAGVMPAVPAVKPPVYVSSITGAPEFSESTTTGDVVTPVSETGTTKNDEAAATPKTEVETNDEFIIVKGFCNCCGEKIEFKINKNEL